MTLNWTNLPSHLLEKIFKYCSITEFKVLSLVCKNWYDEIAYCWSEDFALKCCHLDSDEKLQNLAKSFRQYQSVEICHLHIDLGERIISTLTSRNLRKPCKLVKITLNRIPLSKVVDLLNERARDLTAVTLSELNDDRIDVCHDFKMLNGISHLELKGLLKLSSKNIDALCQGFQNLKTLKLSLTGSNGFSKNIRIIRNLVMKNLETLEDLSVDLEVCTHHSHFCWKPLELLRNLQNLSITLWGRAYQIVYVDFWRHNKNLQTLRLSGCYVSNFDMLKIPKYFGELKSLKLCLGGCVKEACLRAIGELPRLTEIDIIFEDRFPTWFENWFVKCNKNLKTLKLIGCRHFYDGSSKLDAIQCAQSNPLALDTILENLPKLEHLSIKLSSLKLVNPNNLIFSNLKTLRLEDCACQESVHDFYSKFKSPALNFLKTDMPGMTDATVDVILSNFENLKHLHLMSEDKLDIQAMKSLKEAKLEMVSCYNISFEMGKELLRESKLLKFAELRFNVPQMEAEQRILFKKQYKDMGLTADSFDHMQAYQFLGDICGFFNPPLEKRNVGWMVASQCYRKYILANKDLNIEVGIRFNPALDN